MKKKLNLLKSNSIADMPRNMLIKFILQIEMNAFVGRKTFLPLVNVACPLSLVKF